MMNFSFRRSLAICNDIQSVKMKLGFIIVTIGLTLLSCSQEKTKVLQGYWVFDFAEQQGIPGFPYGLCFSGDTLTTIDGFGFKQLVKYQINGDSIELVFSDGSIKEFDLVFYSDSVLSLGGQKFFKTFDDFSDRINPYYLIGLKTRLILKSYLRSMIQQSI